MQLLFKQWNVLGPRRHWWVFTGWERVPWRTGLHEHNWLLPMCDALWAGLQENGWRFQLHRFIVGLYYFFLWAQLIVNLFFDSCLLCHSDVNECQESDPCNQICFNTIGSYRCACEPGFQLRNRRCIGEIFRLSDILFVCIAQNKRKTQSHALFTTLFTCRHKWMQTEGLPFRSAVQKHTGWLHLHWPLPQWYDQRCQWNMRWWVLKLKGI